LGIASKTMERKEKVNVAERGGRTYSIRLRVHNPV